MNHLVNLTLYLRKSDTRNMQLIKNAKTGSVRCDNVIFRKKARKRWPAESFEKTRLKGPKSNFWGTGLTRNAPLYLHCFKFYFA